MQLTTTRVDAVVPALLTAWRALFPTASVLDGPRAAQTLRDDVLVVGVGNGEHAEAYLSETKPEQGLSGRLQEMLTVNCEIVTWSGRQAAEMAPLRTKLVGYLAAIDLAFMADQQLGATCDRIYLGNKARYWPLQSEDGPGMGVEFSVVAEALL